MEICQNCKFFKQPKCSKSGEFKSRKTDACKSFEMNKKKKIQIPKKTESVKRSDDDIKKDILGDDYLNTPIPERPKVKRSDKQRRR